MPATKIAAPKDASQLPAKYKTTMLVPLENYISMSLETVKLSLTESLPRDEDKKHFKEFAEL